jgi:hypothetical protein
MTRRNKGRGKNLKSIISLSLGIILIFVVGGVVITLFVLKPEKVEIDAKTLCPIKDGPSRFTAIVIDRTDSFGAISKADIEIQLKDIIDETKKGEQISLFAVEPIEKEPLHSLIKVCNPGNPDTVDQWTQNPGIMTRNWKTKFQAPLDELLDSLLAEEKASLSPIMESIQSVSITALSGKQKSLLPRRIILISDLLQNSRAWSLYKQQADIDAFSTSMQTRGLKPDLRGVSIELLILQRNTKHRVDETKLMSFWRSWIKKYGGKTTRILKVSGING